MSPSLASVAAAVALILAAASEGRPRTIVDYNVGSHSRRESGLPGVAVEGEYRWRTPNGQENVVRYTADKNGYVARGNVVPGHYDPLGNPRLVHSYYQTPLEASAEAPAEGPSEAAEADNDRVLMTTAQDAEDSPVGEGTDDAIDEKINEILVEKAAEDVPAEEVAEDTSGGDAAEDVSDKEIADDAPAEEVAADASNKKTTEDVPADEVDEDPGNRGADANNSDDAQAETADEVDSTRAEKAVPAEEMAAMNAIIFPDDPSPSVPLVEAVEGMPEAEANEMNAIIFPEDVPVGEMTEPEVSTEDAPAVEMEDQPDMNIIPATEMSMDEDSGAPEIAVPDDSATDESAAEEGILATEAPEEVAPATKTPEEVAPATKTPEEVAPATEAPEEVAPTNEAPEEEDAGEASTEAPTANGDDFVTESPTGEDASDAPAEEVQVTEAPSDVTAPEEAAMTEAPVEEDEVEELPATESPVTEEASSPTEAAFTGEDSEEEVVVTDTPVEEDEATEVPESIAAEREAEGAAVTSAPDSSPELLIMEDPVISEAPVVAADALLMAGGSADNDNPIKEDTAASMSDSAVAMTDDAPPVADDEAVDAALAEPDEIRMPVDAMVDDVPAMPPMRSADEEEQEPEILGYIHSHPHAHFFDDEHHAYPAHPRPQPYRPHFKVYKGTPDGDHKVHHGHVFNFYH